MIVLNNDIINFIFKMPAIFNEGSDFSRLSFTTKSFLSQNKDIVITEADKSRATVIM